MDTTALERLQHDPIDWRYKGFPACEPPTTPATIANQAWSVTRGDLPLPVLLVREDAVASNIATMRAWCEQHDVSLAPHGKTTMAPALFERQLAAGAWAITVACAAQGRVCVAFGVPRILIANEVVDPASIRWVGDAQRSGTEVWLLVDSVAAVDQLVAHRRVDDPDLRVLIELGMPDGRAGARSLPTVEAVAAAVVAAPGLVLAGVSGWEGHIGGPDLVEVEQRVDRYLLELRATVERLAQLGHFAMVDQVVVSAGGSAWFDRVTALLRPDIEQSLRLVLRSGCTVSHDDGLYQRLSPFERGTARDGRLAPALEAWSAVLSVPEPGLAILGMGKRDVSFDIDLPLPKWQARDGVVSSIGECTVVALNDQHAFLRGPAVADLVVGDLVGCGVSHPCTSFDKWRLLPLVDQDRRVISALHTFF